MEKLMITIKNNASYFNEKLTQFCLEDLDLVDIVNLEMYI